MHTLREIMEAHPEWADVQVVIYCPDGTYDYLGRSGTVYLDEEHEDGSVVVFAGN